jgi:hypothetical protein
MKTKYYKFTDKEEAVKVFTQAELYSEEDGFTSFGHNEGAPFGFYVLGNTEKSISTKIIGLKEGNDEEGNVVYSTRTIPREGYLINGAGEVPEIFNAYEIFPVTPISKYAS